MNSVDMRQEEEDYWRKTLADFDRAPFPVMPSSMKQPLADSMIEHQIPQPQQQPLNITTSTLIYAAWALVASHMTESEDVVFGATVSRRNASVIGTDEMACPTIATIPIRIKIAYNQKISDYLESVQQQATEMIPFEQTGLHRIAKMCPGGRQACKFQTLLVIQAQEDRPSQDLLREWQDSRRQHLINTYALLLEVRLDVDKITVTGSFDFRVIEPWTVQKLLERLEFAMRQLDRADSKQMLAGIEMVTPQDMEEIWERNNDVPAPVEQCVHKTIEERAQAHPGAPAVCAWDGELTYGELNQFATLLAGRLVDLGVGPDVLVPVCFEKSMWTTVAILGVLKAGGGFVLLDPSLPEQRLQTIVRQVKPKVFLSSISNQALSSRLGQNVVIVSSGFLAGLGNQGNQHLPHPSPTSVMYVVFTSGSTGTPKGVMITHGNLASALCYQTKEFGCTEESRVFDIAPYSFGASIFNAFLTLYGGGCLCVPSDRDRKNKLSDSIASLRAGHMFLTPSIAKVLIPEELSGLQSIIFGGEAVRVEDVQPWWGGKARILTVYGSTECTTVSMINCIASSPEEATRMGKGAGLVTWVVDPENHNHLLPLGCIGELLLEGPLVGYGYLNDPEKTAAAFIENPAWLLQGASGRPGRHGRLYKTGDLVRYNEDGSLTFIGRKDTQVKIRGQRVELGEVEHCVKECVPGARQVVAEVIVPQGENSSPALVVFVQMEDDVAETDTPESATAKILPITADIEDKLANHLPSYMVPTMFFSMRKLPMTLTLKTDRRQLREIGGSFSIQQLAEMRTTRQGTKRQPSTQTERQMQSIWARALKIEQSTIGLDDSFIELGGDSISVMEVVDEARKIGMELTAVDIFLNPTLENISHLDIDRKELDEDFDQNILVDPIVNAAL